MKRVEGVMHPSWGRTPKEEGRRYLSFLFGVKNAVLVPLRVFSLKRSTAGAFAVPVRVLRRKEAGGGVAEWIRALDLKSGGPWFKSSSCRYLDLFSAALSSTPRPRCVNSQLVSLPPVGILNSLCHI